MLKSKQSTHITRFVKVHTLQKITFQFEVQIQFWVRVKTMDFSISEMDLSICAAKNNHINCIIIILNFVNLSLKENVIISVFILKVPILQPYGNNSTNGVFFL